MSPLYPSNITVVAGDVSAIAQKDNIVPRIGIAYAFDDKSVLRAGYGHLHIETRQFRSAEQFRCDFTSVGVNGSVFSISEVYFNVTSPGTAPLLHFPDPFPSSTASATVPSQSVNGYPQHVDHRPLQQYS